MLHLLFADPLPAWLCTLLAAATAFALSLLVGPRLIAMLRRLKLQDGACTKASETLAKLHEKSGKAATPTMGGVMIVLAFSGALLLWAPLSWPVLAGWIVVVGFGAVGLVDDRVKLLGKARGVDGLKGRTRLALEFTIAAAASLVLVLTSPAGPDAQTTITLPLVGATLPLGGAWLLLAMVAIVGAANAANLTDGLDGLASGVVGVAATAIALGGVLLVSANTGGVNAQWAAIFAASLAGACFGFLCFNAHPARVFMGDTGSLAIGAGLGYAALLARQEVLLVVIGGVLVIETLSVILQVGSFKLTGRRIFRCAPIHHHFQFMKWSETRIVRSFWLAGVACAALGLALMLAV
ncbi:MAG: phospho-N-acetylmuramoyl-pentapeptide-transferase [Planctomycetota bacterium]